MNAGSRTVVVLADAEFDDLAAAARAEVIAGALTARLGPLDVRTATCAALPAELRIAPSRFTTWQRALAGGPSVIVACGARARDTAAADAPGIPMVATSALDGSEPDLAPRFTALVDPLTVDVRLRTLAALGLLPEDGRPLDGEALAALRRALPPTPTDLVVLIRSGLVLTAQDDALEALRAAPSVAIEEHLGELVAGVAALLGESAEPAESADPTAGQVEDREIELLRGRVEQLIGERRALAERLALAELRFDELVADGSSRQ